jgi:hypothetical protein
MHTYAVEGACRLCPLKRRVVPFEGDQGRRLWNGCCGPGGISFRGPVCGQRQGFAGFCAAGMLPDRLNAKKGGDHA